MTTRWITNSGDLRTSVRDAIQSALNNATRADIAVSYVQLSGWELLEGRLANLGAGNVRMLITDQLAITQPEALRRALASGVTMRNFEGRIYHPKVFLFYGTNGRPNAAILGSANLSEPALTTSVEAGVITTDRRLLSQLRRWFQRLFTDTRQTVEVDDALVNEMNVAWERAAATRARSSRHHRQALGATPSKELAPEEKEVLDDLFATIRVPIGVLSFDHAGNNVRNLQRARGVLRRYPKLSSKEKSELRLLGFLADGQLTKLGEVAADSPTERSLAERWCRWIAKASEADLVRINDRLASFKRAASRFWTLKKEVRDFFLPNLRDTHQRQLLQTIELLCNASESARELSLDQIRRFAPVLMRARGLSEFVARRVRDYRENKGGRSWDTQDRRTVLLAWRRVAKRTR